MDREQLMKSILDLASELAEDETVSYQQSIDDLLELQSEIAGMIEGLEEAEAEEDD